MAQVERSQQEARETGKEKGKWGRGKEQEKEYEKEVTDAKDCEKKQSIVRNASEW